MGCGSSSDSIVADKNDSHEGAVTFQPLIGSSETKHNSNQRHGIAEINTQTRLDHTESTGNSGQDPSVAETNIQPLLGNVEPKSNPDQQAPTVATSESEYLVVNSEAQHNTDKDQAPIVKDINPQCLHDNTEHVTRVEESEIPSWVQDGSHTDTQEKKNGFINDQVISSRYNGDATTVRNHHPGREFKRASKTVEFAKTWMRHARHKKDTQPSLSEPVNKALLGDIDMTCPSPSKIVRIFTSSTFTDTKNERNMLMKHAYPKVKEHCRRIGYDFQVVDMRWGVRDEATDDHTTTELCLKELRLCKEVSTGPYFVTFLSHKYGYLAFPRVIEAVEFETIMTGVDDEENKQLFERWYTLDNNALPPAYILSPISSRIPDFLSPDEEKKQIAKNSWWQQMANMQNCLGVTVSKVFGKDRARTYTMSVTETELTEGLLKSEDPSRHSLWFKRDIEDIEDQKSSRLLSRFKECHDSGEHWKKSQDMLKELKEEKVAKKLSHERIFNYSVRWNNEAGINPENDETHQDYLDQMCKDFVSSMTEMIDTGVAEREHTNDSLVDECCQHIRFCQSKCEGFHGRQDTLELIKTYVQGSSSEILVLHGSSGSGKTSIMAKAAQLINTWTHKSPMLVIRFLGTTSDSSSLMPLLKSLVSQIRRIYKLTPLPPTEESLYDVTRQFKKSLKHAGTTETPLVLMLDSLDQLDPANDARKLGWLIKKLGPGTKVIVSTLPEPIYECFPSLQSGIRAESNFVRVPAMDTTDVRAILDNWLTMRQRRLTDHQLTCVLGAFRSCPTPLFLMLSFEEAVTWSSFMPAGNAVLQDTVRASIDVLFQRLEKVHGQLLVSRALGYLTIADNGATEAELEDILSCDDAVLNDVYTYWTPPVRRLPPLLLVRIRQDLSQYLVERGIDGIHVIYWYHRQFIEAAKARYCSDKTTNRLMHQSLADFFNGTWATGKKKPYINSKGEHGEEDRLVSLQPLKFGPNNYNLRTLNNLPYHLIKASSEALLKDQCLANPTFLVHKLDAASVNSVCRDYAMARDMFPEDEFFNDVLQALNLSKGPLAFDARQLIPQLLQRLDKSNATKQLLQRCKEYPSTYMLPAKCLVARAGEQLVHYIPAYQGDIKDTRIKHMDITADGKLLLTENRDTVKVWDVDDGTQKRKVKGLDQVRFCNNDRWLVGQDKNHKLIFQTLETGVNVLTLSNDDVPLCIPVGTTRTVIAQFKENACTLTRLLANETETAAPIPYPSKFVIGKQSEASGSNNYLALTSSDKKFITVYDLNTQQFLPSFQGFPNDEIREIVISPKEPYLIYTQKSCFKDVVFSDFNGNKLRSISNPRKRHYCSPNITSNGRHLYISDSKDGVYFFDTNTLQEVGKLNQWHDKVICHSKTKVVTGTTDGYLRIWDRSRRETSSEEESAQCSTKLDKSSDNHIHPLNNPRYVLCGGQARDVGKLMLEVYDVFTNAGVRWGELIHNERYVQLSRVITTKNDLHVILVLGLTKHSDTGGCKQWRIVRVNLQTMTLVKTYIGVTGMHEVKMAADTEEILCTTRGSMHMKLYDEDGNVVTVMKEVGQDEKIKYVEVNSTGTVACASTSVGFMLYDLKQRKHLYNIVQEDIRQGYMINRAGTRLVYKVTDEDGEPLGICIWDIQAKNKLRTIYDIEFDISTSMTYELDDTRFLTTSFEGDLLVWSMFTGEMLAQMCGHTGPPDAYLHTKSPYILSERYNKRVGKTEDRFLLWDKTTYQCVASYSLLEEKEDEDVLGWSMDGKFLLTLGQTPTRWNIYNGHAHTTVKESDYPHTFSQKDESAARMILQDCSTEEDPDSDPEDLGDEYEETGYNDDSFCDEEDYEGDYY